MVQLSLSSKPTHEITEEYDLSPTLIHTMVKQFNKNLSSMCKLLKIYRRKNPKVFILTNFNTKKLLECSSSFKSNYYKSTSFSSSINIICNGIVNL